MWCFVVYLSLLLCGCCQVSFASCEIYREAYQKEIRPKIEAGVPFELMSAWFEDGSLVSKKSIHIQYDLWDEVVTVKLGDELLKKFPIKEGLGELCKALEVRDLTPKSHAKYTYRLLLNPLWSERIIRLQAYTGAAISQKNMMGVDWNKLAREMPSEKVLLEKEGRP